MFDLVDSDGNRIDFDLIDSNSQPRRKLWLDRAPLSMGAAANA